MLELVAHLLQPRRDEEERNKVAEGVPRPRPAPGLDDGEASLDAEPGGLVGVLRWRIPVVD